MKNYKMKNEYEFIEPFDLAQRMFNRSYKIVKNELIHEDLKLMLALDITKNSLNERMLECNSGSPYKNPRYQTAASDNLFEVGKILNSVQDFRSWITS